MEAAQLLLDLLGTMCRMVVEAKVRFHSAIGVPQGAGQLDKELLEARDVGRRRHHVLGRAEALADGTV